MVTAPNLATIKMPRPHPSQMQVFEHRGSTVLFAGRRWGKTQIAVYRLIREATEIIGLYWWVGLSWRAASLKRAWRLIKYYVGKMWQAMGVYDDRKWANKSDKEITLPNKSIIWFRTAKRPDSLAGEGVRGVVMDEFSLMPPEIWDEYIQATLIDYMGWVFMMGVPKGKNWAWNLWNQALSRFNWKQFHFTVYDNPHMTRTVQRQEFLEDIKFNAPEYFWKQEYLAEVLDDGGTVFRGVLDIATVPLDLGPTPGMRYVAGLDWGKESDYTAIVIIEVETSRVVFVDRFNKISWHLQWSFLETIHKHWKLSFILGEANSIGSVNVEEMMRRGLPIEGFDTTSKSKPRIIEALSAAIERAVIAIPKHPVLVSELQAYTMERTSTGFRYSAPSGMHDDTVIAFALAYEAFLTRRSNSLPSWVLDHRG